MQRDIEGESSLAHAEDGSAEGEVPGAADREELREPLKYGQSEDRRRGGRIHGRGGFGRLGACDLSRRGHDRCGVGQHDHGQPMAAAGSMNSMPKAWATGAQVSLPATAFAAVANSGLLRIASFAPSRASFRA